MKNISLFLVTLLFLLASCGNENTSKTEQKIINYQKQVTTINKKIDRLQQKLNRRNKNKVITTGRKVTVNVRKLQPAVFNHYFDASAEIESVHEAYVSPEVNGQVEKIFVTAGDRVKKGQLLAQLNSDIMQDNIRELKTSLELASYTYEKQKALWKKKIGSELQYLQAKTNYESLRNKLNTLQTQYQRSFITSPIEGYVDAIDLKVGEMAIPGQRFFHVVNLSRLYVNAQISEAYLPIIHEGDAVEVRFSAFPSIVMHKKVYRIGKVINKQSRTFKLQLKINNPKQLLRPNLLAIIRIKDYTNLKAIVVPSFVVREDIQGDYLYVVTTEDGQKIARKRYVKTGKSFKKKTEVIGGLKAGETIITQGYNNVTNGSALNIRK
ncbi:Probable Co/Zn/Cd efflux system membrane fusion protein [hydrothermal vent metagenome]|uniref:Probable Co/Zn/Cd efflux system membrane fusion protein n=1 Tax=hydrothermal vent metagenome TaxID=652676 RepID=A0A3B0UY83_9ZZZZ